MTEGKRNPLKRFYGQGDLHFVTFSCYRRQPYLGTARARDRFVQMLGEVRDRYEFALIGYVVMPEHVHLLMSEGKQVNPSRVLQVPKQKVSRALQLEMAFVERGQARAFWQRRFYDFNVWSEKKLREKLEYMHENPVKRGLVQHPKDWPWSSWSFHAGKEAIFVMDVLKPGDNARENPHPYKSKGAAPELF